MTKPCTCTCGAPLDRAAFLDATPSDSVGRSGMLVAACSACKESVEMRLGGGRVEVGYTYAAGSSHLEVLHVSRVSGLRRRAPIPATST